MQTTDTRDRHLPASEEELRDWLVKAWKDGWSSARSLIGKPMGTIIHQKPVKLSAFLRAWDLEPPPASMISVQESIKREGLK